MNILDGFGILEDCTSANIFYFRTKWRSINSTSSGLSASCVSSFRSSRFRFVGCLFINSTLLGRWARRQELQKGIKDSSWTLPGCVEYQTTLQYPSMVKLVWVYVTKVRTVQQCRHSPGIKSVWWVSRYPGYIQWIIVGILSQVIPSHSCWWIPCSS